MASVVSSLHFYSTRRPTRNMFSQWLDVKLLLILYEKNIHSIAIFITFIASILIVCSKKEVLSSESQRQLKTSKEKNSLADTTSVLATDTTTTRQAAAAPPPAPVNQQPEPKKAEMLDSIKIIKGKKNVRQARQLPGRKDGTDSQHTELINIPLGKAAESAVGVSKLTSPSDLKHVEKPSKKKIQFAENLVKSPKQQSQKGKVK